MKTLILLLTILLIMISCSKDEDLLTPAILDKPSAMYLKTYVYDSINKLIKILDGENIIEVNDYVDNKLIEKRTYYFGIDPGYDVCYGNYICRYQY